MIIQFNEQEFKVMIANGILSTHHFKPAVEDIRIESTVKLKGNDAHAITVVRRTMKGAPRNRRLTDDDLNDCCLAYLKPREGHDVVIKAITVRRRTKPVRIECLVEFVSNQGNTPVVDNVVPLNTNKDAEPDAIAEVLSNDEETGGGIVGDIEVDGVIYDPADDGGFSAGVKEDLDQLQKWQEDNPGKLNASVTSQYMMPTGTRVTTTLTAHTMSE